MAASLAPIADSCLLVSLASAARESLSAARAQACEAKASITSFCCCCSCCCLLSSPSPLLVSEKRTRSSLGGGTEGAEAKFLLGGAALAAAPPPPPLPPCFFPRKSFGVGKEAEAEADADEELEAKNLTGEDGAEDCLLFPLVSS
jgi:hypothetical protein